MITRSGSEYDSNQDNRHRASPTVKQAYVKLACNRVISPGISHIACESDETAIRTFMFGCLFSIFHHATKNVSLIENTDQTFSL